MAGSINWSSYSSTQILQMQKLGIEVPEDVLAEATTTAEQNFQTNDDVIRESANIDLEEFMNSEEFSSAKLKDQVGMLGEAQESKYKEAFEAAKVAGEIADAMNTLSSAIDTQISDFEVEMAEFETDNNGEVTDETAKKYKQATSSMLNLASGASANADQLKALNEKAIVAETFAEKAGEQADKFLGRRSAIRKTIGAVVGSSLIGPATIAGVVGATTGGAAIFDNFLKGKKVKAAEHVKERSEHIISESQNFENIASDTLSKMNSISQKADDAIQRYKEQQKPPEQEEE
ncbi:hypothetical protein IKE67_03390 [bacterium]|nr:hypothetical protein [bacterium]